MRSCLGLGRLLDPHARAPGWMRSMRVPALIRGSSMSRYARHGVERSSVRARIKKWIAGASAAALGAGLLVVAGFGVDSALAGAGGMPLDRAISCAAVAWAMCLMFSSVARFMRQSFPVALTPFASTRQDPCSLPLSVLLLDPG